MDYRMLRILMLGLKILITVLLMSCKDKNNDSNEPIDIERNLNNFKPFSLSDLECNLDYIVLETTPDAMLMAIRYVDISDDYIIVSDREKCLLFDRSGQYISKIGNKGKGPGEYSFIAQIRIVNNKIFLPDALKNELIIFNTKGELISIVKTPGQFSISSSNWMPLSDSIYLIQIPNRTGNEKLRIAMIDNDGDILVGYPNTTFFTPHNPAAFNSNDLTAHFYKSNNEIYYKERLIDTIWQIKNNNLHPAHILNLGKFGFPVQHRELPMNLYFKKLPETIPIANVFGSKKYLFFILGYGKHYPFTFFRESNIGSFMGIVPPDRSPYNIIGLYNKLTEEFFVIAPSNVDDQIEPTGIENDIDGGINFVPKYAVNDSILVGWFDAYQLKMYVTSESFKNATPKYPEKKRKLEELATSLDANDNPVLMIVKLKN